MLLLMLGWGAAPGAAQVRSITLVPMGPVAPEVLAHLQSGLQKELAATIKTAGEIALPEGAYAPNRQQYLADAFLPLLSAQRRAGTDLILGGAAVDLYVPSLNFVFGLADPRQKTCIISLARLDPQFYSLPADPPLLRQRALKEAVHELGHCLGLGHCPDPNCIMFFSNTLADTDRKGPGFCPRCRRVVER